MQRLKNRFPWGGLAATALLTLFLWPAFSSGNDQGRCHRCGCAAVTAKVCRPIAETKKISKTVFECECEDFCIPGPSTRSGKSCTADGCGHFQHEVHWQPGCGQSRTRKVLKKSTVEEEVVTYRWVVEECCATCAAMPAPASSGAYTPPHLEPGSIPTSMSRIVAFPRLDRILPPARIRAHDSEETSFGTGH